MNVCGNFWMKDGRKITLKKLTVEVCEQNENYEYMHEWLNKVSRFLPRDFLKKDLSKDKKEFYLLLKNEETIIIGGLYEGKIVAQARLAFYLERDKIKHCGRWSIMIHPDFHNQGLGLTLLQGIENIAYCMGLTRLEAAYIDGNKPAERLYIDKLQYVIEGRKKNAFMTDDGVYRDRIMIGKMIYPLKK